MFSDSKTMVTLVIYTCKSVIKLTPGWHQSWEPNPLPLMLWVTNPVEVGGGGSNTLQEANGDVPLDEVALSWLECL